MKIAILTSSRADFGIYLPLLKALRNNSFFDTRLIVFGTHLSAEHGYTIEHIIKEGFAIDHTIDTVPDSDTPESIAAGIGITVAKFSKIWAAEQHNYDLVFCLGDRYEMFAAVSSAVSFGVPFAHIHGGETTLGAIDNKFRDCLTHFSVLHFASTDKYAQRIKNLTGSNLNVYNVGALSLDNMNDLSLFNTDEMKTNFQIDFSIPTLLITYHPETAGTRIEQKGGQHLITALKQIEGYQFVVTMPNADTYSGELRKAYTEFAISDKRVRLIENFGTKGYFSAMQLSKAVIGNSSSGIIEAASFKKYAVDIGNRQAGRAISDNIIHTSNEESDIANGISEALLLGDFYGKNIYDNGGATKKIIDVLQIWQK